MPSQSSLRNTFVSSILPSVSATILPETREGNNASEAVQLTLTSTTLQAPPESSYSRPGGDNVMRETRELTSTAISNVLPGEGLDLHEAREFAEVLLSLQLSMNQSSPVSFHHFPNSESPISSGGASRDDSFTVLQVHPSHMVPPSDVPSDPNIASDDQLEDVSVADTEDYDADDNASVASSASNDTEDVVGLLFECSIQWMLRFPTAASHFALDNNPETYLRVRTVGAGIQQVEVHFLPHIIRVFATALPFVCGNSLFDDDGYLELKYMLTTITTLSSMAPSFWSSNTSIRDVVVAAFPGLYVWIVAVGKMVSHNSYPVQGRRYEALCAINYALWVIRDVGSVASDFIRRHTLWDDALFVWTQPKDCSPREENVMASIFLHAKAMFVRATGGAFLWKILNTLEEYRMDASVIIPITLARIRLARRVTSSRDYVHDQLLVLQALVDGNEEEFVPDESPFQNEFLNHEGMLLVLETMHFCTSVSQWAAVDACIEVVAAVLRHSRSNRAIYLAFQSKLIQRLMYASFHAEELSVAGRDMLELLLREVLPEVLLYRSVVLLAGDLERPTDVEIRIKLLVSRYRVEWDHLFNVYSRLRSSYERLEGIGGRKYDYCANVNCMSTEKARGRCSACMMHSYCSAECQREVWRNGGHERGCVPLRNAHADLRTTPKDAYYLLLLVQQDLQHYINTKGIGADNTAAFELTYNQHFIGGSHEILPTVSEFHSDALPGQILLTLPVLGGDDYDFNAVVKVAVMRNLDEPSLFFSAGFNTRFGHAEDVDD